jgi:RNA polymerase sigma-70 factor (ECF subfamily)
LKDKTLHTDKELFAQVAVGNEAAFEQMFHKYVVPVGQIAFRIVKLESATQDIVQDVFVQLWLGRHKLVEVDDPDLWIYRIVYNQSYEYIRRQVRREKATAILGIEQALLAHANNTQETLDYGETSRLIQQAIHQLHPQARKIYQLSRIDGLKAQHIADELGISVQGVRNSLTRSAKLIRDYLAQHGIPLPMFLFLITISELL